MAPRLKEKYNSEIREALRAEFKHENVMQVGGLTKIVVNMGVGEAARDSKALEGAIRDLTAITGQKPVTTRAKKSIAQFKLREGQAIGAHVTLRGDRMWEFLDRLLSTALPVSVTSADCPPSSSTVTATTPSVSRSSRCSTRSTRTRSTECAAWTSRLSPRPPPTKRVAPFSVTSASRSRRTDPWPRHP